jgi:hypothetical protein
VQSVPIITKVVNLNLVYCDMYSVQHFVIKFVSDLWQIGMDKQAACKNIGWKPYDSKN